MKGLRSTATAPPIGERIRTARELKGLTQKDLGNILGVSDGAVANYENSKREPNLETVLRLADLFGVTTDWLLGREGPAEARETISGYGEPVVNRATSLSGGTFRPRFGAIILAAIRSSKSG